MLKETNQLSALLLQCDTFEEELFQAQIDSGIDVDALLSQSVPQALAAAKARRSSLTAPQQHNQTSPQPS
jgi:hypothetical protein